MIAPPAAPRRALKETFKESLARFVAAAPYVRHMRPAAALPEERRLLDERAALVALAIDRLSGE